RILWSSRFQWLLANVAVESHANHVAAHGERNALRSRMRRAAGREDEFFDLQRIIKCQELCYHATHGVAADGRERTPALDEISSLGDRDPLHCRKETVARRRGFRNRDWHH